MAIHFDVSPEIKFKLYNKSKLKTWIAKVAGQEKKRIGELNFLFAGDQEVWQANKKYLQHDTYTDIITFDDSEGDLLRGDILISIERVKENAIKFKTDFETELRRVIIHGILHLCGYSDKSKPGTAKMRERENKALGLYARMLKK